MFIFRLLAREAGSRWKLISKDGLLTLLPPVNHDSRTHTLIEPPFLKSGPALGFTSYQRNTMEMTQV